MAGELRIGVIGTGRIGRLHASHLSNRISGARLTAVADVIRDAVEEVGASLGVPLVTEKPEELIESPEVDAVVICSSTDTHAEFMTKAAQAGKHVFCEKPIDLELEPIDRALEAVDKAGVKLQIGFNRRFDSNYRRVWEHVRAGNIGEPHILRITSRDPGPPPIDYVKVSGGLFVDMMIHDFDMARYLIGNEVEEVFTAAGVMVDPEIGKVGDVDTALVTLKFESGTIGTIDNSRKAVFGYDQRVEVFGSGGMVRTQNNHPNTAELSTGKDIAHDLPLNFFMERYIDSYIAEMEAFVKAVTENTPTPVSGMDGRIPIVLGKAAGKSLAEHRPVAVKEVGG